MLQRRTHKWDIGSQSLSYKILPIDGLDASFAPVALCRSKDTTYVVARNSGGSLSSKLYSISYDPSNPDSAASLHAELIDTFDDSTYGVF